MLTGQLFDVVVINLLVVLAHAVGHEFVHAARKIQRVAVRQMPAVRQVHPEHDVARLERGHIHSDVRLRAGVRLHVGVCGAEELLRAVNGKLFGLVRELASAVIALARIAFGVLVGENRAHGFEHRFRYEVFRRDQLEPGRLPPRFLAQHVGNLRVHVVQRTLHPLIGCCGPRRGRGHI